MARLSFAEATCQGLAEEMRRDPRVWALGEDLGLGGIFGQYKGLIEEFGPARIVSTPIAEATIMGAGLGAALVGTRPVIEMRIADFALCAIDELVNQLAKVRYMFGGQARVPAVVRMPYGTWRNSAAQHSQALESWFIHVPGLVVLAPGTAADAKGLLKAAIRAEDPVVLFEPKDRWTTVEEVPEGEFVTPIGSARVARAGDDVTIVTWSAALQPAAEATALAEHAGISVELIDLRSLWPWDQQTVQDSVAKTGRLLVVHEAVRVSGFGAEIAATIAETAAASLKAPVRRLGAPRTPVPFSPPLEAAYGLTAERILREVQAVASAGC